MTQTYLHSDIVMLDPLSVIEAFHSDTSLNESVVRQALQPGSSDVRCFALGRNEHTQKLLGVIRIDGIIDDFAPTASSWQGVRVIKSSDVPAASIIINCAMSISPLSAGGRVAALNHSSVITYSDLCRDPFSPVAQPDFVNEARVELTVELPRYTRVFGRLADRESRLSFNKIMAYRLTADPVHMHGFTVRLNAQYFEPFLGSLEEAVFVDCGGYDGDTTEIFVSHYPQYKKIYLFEPSDTNMQLARARLVHARDIEFIQLGVSDRVGNLQFNADAGSASSVSPSGASQIDVTTLDTYVQQPVSFVKMDLEGWELRALIGAQNHIRENVPILAIAVYHRIADFWKIPEYILSLQPEYQIYLRHYTEGWSETVMYFVPPKLHLVK